MTSTRLTSATLSNFYSQLYLTFFTSTGKQVDRVMLTENTRFVPSVAFTGNFARQNQLFQYYGGEIVDPDRVGHSKAYVGGAYSGSDPKARWSWKVEGQGILHSFDRPVSQNQVGLSPVRSFSVGTGIDFGRILPVRLTLDYIPEIFGVRGIKQTLTANVAIRISDRIFLSGFYAPIADSSSKVRSGARLDFALGRDPASLQLSFGWSLNQYDLPGSTFNDYQFTLGLRVGSR